MSGTLQSVHGVAIPSWGSRRSAPRWKKSVCGTAVLGLGSRDWSVSAKELSVLRLDLGTQIWNLTCFKRITSLGPSVSASCPTVRGRLSLTSHCLPTDLPHPFPWLCYFHFSHVIDYKRPPQTSSSYSQNPWLCHLTWSKGVCWCDFTGDPKVGRPTWITRSQLNAIRRVLIRRGRIRTRNRPWEEARGCGDLREAACQEYKNL